MLRFNVIFAAWLTVTTSGLTKFSQDTRRISDGSGFDEGLFTNCERIAQQSTKVLQSARARRKAAHKLNTTLENPSLGTDALRLMRQTNDYLNLFRDGHMPNIIASPETKKYFQALFLGSKNAEELGGNTALRAAMISKAKASPVLYIGHLVDMVDFVALIVSGFYPKASNIVEAIVFVTWWAVGIAVFMTEGGMHFIEAAYALMQMPTTIGFGDLLPDQEQYGLKLFHATHIMVSSAFVSGRMNYYIDWILDFIDKKMKFETDAQKMITSGIELLAEGLFSTFFYAWEFNQGSGQSFALDLVDSFYMTIIGLTTVGYGDFSPQTLVGRGLGFFWGHFGTQTAARFLDAWDNVRHTLPEREIKIKNPETGNTETIKTTKTLEEMVETATPTTTNQ